MIIFCSLHGLSNQGEDNMVKPDGNGQSPNSNHHLNILEVPLYADPKNIRKYESIEDIYGERPAYVVQKNVVMSKRYG
jgi:hypothetical protein